MSGVDAGPAWSAWARITPVVAARASSGERYARLAVPTAVSPDANGEYPDLRVVDARGDEVPYALDAQREQMPQRDVAMIDRGFVARRYTQAVIDLGNGRMLVDALALDIDDVRRPTYFERVAVDASDDRTTWRAVRDDAIVYRVAQDAGHGNATLTFPATRQRWLRVRVLDPAAPFPLTGARVVGVPARAPELVPIASAPAERDDAALHAQRWTFAPDQAVRPTAVAFGDRGTSYERTVTVETSDDGGKEWNAIGDGAIARYAQGGARATVPLTETTTRLVRVTVSNGDDAPVPGLRPTLLARRHDVVFVASGREYRLLSGNANATAPSYDLGARLAHESWRARDARADATVANTGYRDTRPIGERFPWLITAALVAVAAALGFVGLRTLRTAGA